MTKEERKARAVAQKIVDALAELELFNGDPAFVLDATGLPLPNKRYFRMGLSNAQHASIRNMVSVMECFMNGDTA